QPAQQLAQRFGRPVLVEVLHQGAGTVEQLVGLQLDDGVEQFLDAGEVGVEGAPAEPGRGRQLVHGDPVRALLGEDDGGGFEEPLAGVDPAARAGAGGRRPGRRLRERSEYAGGRPDRRRGRTPAGASRWRVLTRLRVLGRVDVGTDAGYANASSTPVYGPTGGWGGPGRRRAVVAAGAARFTQVPAGILVRGPCPADPLADTVADRSPRSARVRSWRATAPVLRLDPTGPGRAARWREGLGWSSARRWWWR